MMINLDILPSRHISRTATMLHLLISELELNDFSNIVIPVDTKNLRLVKFDQLKTPPSGPINPEAKIICPTKI